VDLAGVDPVDLADPAGVDPVVPVDPMGVVLDQMGRQARPLETISSGPFPTTIMRPSISTLGAEGAERAGGLGRSMPLNVSGELPARIVAWYWPSSKRLTFSQIGQDRKNVRRPVGETRVRQIEREAIEFIHSRNAPDEIRRPSNSVVVVDTGLPDLRGPEVGMAC